MTQSTPWARSFSTGSLFTPKLLSRRCRPNNPDRTKAGLGPGILDFVQFEVFLKKNWMFFNQNQQCKKRQSLISNRRRRINVDDTVYWLRKISCFDRFTIVFSNTSFFFKQLLYLTEIIKQKLKKNFFCQAKKDVRARPSRRKLNRDWNWTWCPQGNRVEDFTEIWRGKE